MESSAISLPCDFATSRQQDRLVAANGLGQAALPIPAAFYNGAAGNLQSAA
jgi:hypothetical protein